MTAWVRVTPSSGGRCGACVRLCATVSQRAKQGIPLACRLGKGAAIESRENEERGRLQERLRESTTRGDGLVQGKMRMNSERERERARKEGRQADHWSRSPCGFGSGKVGARQTGHTRERRNHDRMQCSWKLGGGVLWSARRQGKEEAGEGTHMCRHSGRTTANWSTLNRARQICERMSGIRLCVVHGRRLIAAAESRDALRNRRIAPRQRSACS